MKNESKQKYLFFAGLIVLAFLTRLIHHIPNVTPIFAITLLGASIFSDKRVIFGVPLLIMLISDLIIGFHDTFFAVYLSIAVTALIGSYLLKQRSWQKIVGASLASSIVFFLVSNLAVWAVGNWYPMTFEGLTLCFVKAIPFFRNALIGDLIYSVSLFGIFALVQRFALEVKPQKI